MRFKNLDLVIVMFIIAINIAWTQVPNRFMLAGALFVLSLILFLPGYALTQVLFRRRAPEQDEGASGDLTPQVRLRIGHPVGKTDQIVLGLGLSMAIDVLVGFALNFLPIGLNAFSWTISLSLITTVCLLLAAIFRRKDLPRSAKMVRVRITIVDILLFVLALLIVFSATWFSLNRPINPQPSFAQLWMLPANQASKSCAVSLGIQSFATDSEAYRVVVNVNHARTNSWSSITLDPQQKWVHSLSMTPGTANSLYIEALLYRVAKPDTVYRSVHLTFYISSLNLNGLVRQQCLVGTQS